MANTTANDVYNHVRSMIINREVFPGNRLVEEALAAVLHTSRATVRSGLTRLYYDGLVDIQRHRGTFVAQPNVVEMNHIYSLREVLETHAALRAMERITKAGIKRMEKIIEKQIELEENYSMAEFVRLNQDFHWEIIKAAENEYLEKFLRELFNKSAIFLIFYDNSNSIKLSIKTHQNLLAALKAKDREALIAAVKDDITLATDCITIN